MRLVRGRSTPAIRAIALSLPLLVLLIGTDHPHHAVAADDLALVTNPFDRRSYLHRYFLSTFNPDTAEHAENNFSAISASSALIAVTASLRQLPYNPPAPHVHGRQLQSHPVADQQPHEIAVDPIRD